MNVSKMNPNEIYVPRKNDDLEEYCKKNTSLDYLLIYFIVKYITKKHQLRKCKTKTFQFKF